MTPDLPALVSRIAPRATDLGRACLLSTAARVLPAHGLLYPLRLAHFLAQVLVETGALTRLEENLRYSARRLMAVWPGRFPTLESALPYAWDSSDPDREDVALANRVYGARMGNEADGTNDDDGWDYRGRGLLQITGQGLYAEIGRRAGLDLVGSPDLAVHPDHALAVACAVWDFKRLSPLAEADDCREITRRINGGLTSLPERLEALALVKRAMGMA